MTDILAARPYSIADFNEWLQEHDHASTIRAAKRWWFGRSEARRRLTDLYDRFCAVRFVHTMFPETELGNCSSGARYRVEH